MAHGRPAVAPCLILLEIGWTADKASRRQFFLPLTSRPGFGRNQTCLHGIDEADSWHEASNKKDQHHHDGKIGRGGGWWPTPRCCKATVHAEDRRRSGPLSGRHGGSFSSPALVSSFPEARGDSSPPPTPTPPHHQGQAIMPHCEFSRWRPREREVRRKIGTTPVGPRSNRLVASLGFPQSDTSKQVY